MIGEASAKAKTFSPRVKSKSSSIQYGYELWGTRAQVFSQTLMQGRARMKYDNETEEVKTLRVSMEVVKQSRKKKTGRPSYAQAYSRRVAIPQSSGWITELTYTYNQSTTPGEEGVGHSE